MDSPNGTFHQIISPGSLLISSAIFLFDEESIVYRNPMHFFEMFLLSEKSSVHTTSYSLLGCFKDLSLS